MKKMRKVLCVVLAALMSIPFCSCSSSESIIKNEYAEMIESANVGDIITFGEYEQDGDLLNGKEKIEWIVLDKKYGEILVVSKYILEYLQYGTTRDNLKWQKSSLRQWLNCIFLNEAFNESEQAAIKDAVVSADRNYFYFDSSYDPNNSKVINQSGEETRDKIFLLSVTEAYIYFESDEERKCESTNYAINQVENRKDNWWTRSPMSEMSMSAVASDGIAGGAAKGRYANDFRGTAANEKSGVRPAMWLTTGEVIEQNGKSKKVNVGDFVFFGTYEQDNDLSNGKEPIEWIVLDKNDTSALLISKMALDCKKYNVWRDEAVNWENCSLRTWLNNNFLKDAFNEKEQAAIQDTNVRNDINQFTDNDNAGGNTIDKIFLLDMRELKRYFPSHDSQICGVTAYAIANGASYNKSSIINDMYCGWWLRSVGGRCGAMVVISEVDLVGYVVDANGGCVRPAMWVDLSSIKRGA